MTKSRTFRNPMFTKKKVKNRTQHTQRKTIDSTHSAQLTSFEENTETCSVLKTKQATLQSELDALEQIPKRSLTNEQFDRLYEIEEDIKSCAQEIATLENAKNDYFMKTGHLLFNYYIQKDASESNSNAMSQSSNARQKEHTVLDFFTPSAAESKAAESSTMNQDNSESAKQDTMNQIIDQYMDEVDTSYTKAPEKDPFMEYCPTCHCFKIFNETESTLLCTKCGVEDAVLMNHSKPSYKDPPREYTFFAYKRINHFNEWLSQFQAKESTHIPDQIIEDLELEIKKERRNKNALDRKQIRRFLKKLGYNKYYEHIPHIINKLNGVPPPIITQATEETLRSMFKMIQVPFVKHCPEKRKNFLSYSYVLHKFVQLLGMHELTACFPLLKSRQKLYQQDTIWKKICKELEWPFIKSV